MLSGDDPFFEMVNELTSKYTSKTEKEKERTKRIRAGNLKSRKELFSGPTPEQELLEIEHLKRSAQLAYA